MFYTRHLPVAVALADVNREAWLGVLAASAIGISVLVRRIA
ncbi:hypothetical protein [Halosimplex carlsbadense]|nr:hypothetical protein [Halosimplex carlsbadense]